MFVCLFVCSLFVCFLLLASVPVRSHLQAIRSFGGSKKCDTKKKKKKNIAILSFHRFSIHSCHHGEEEGKVVQASDAQG
jgi:hypothetical protein